MRSKPLITAELHKGFSRDQGFIHLCERVKSWFKPSAFLNSWNNLFFFFFTFRPTKIVIKTVWWTAFFDICARHSFLLKIVFYRNNLFPSCRRTSELELRKIQPWRLLIASYFRKVCMFRESLVKASVVTKGPAIVSDKLPLRWHFGVIPRSGSIGMATGWYLGCSLSDMTGGTRSSEKRWHKEDLPDLFFHGSQPAYLAPLLNPQKCISWKCVSV